MMTQEQIIELAKYFQIDTFTIVREYLQLLFLNCLYQNDEASKVFFKGGTAIRLLFLSPRFSEDLDFSTTLSTDEIPTLMKRTEIFIQRDLPEAKILFLHSDKDGLRYRIKYEAPEFKYPQIVRLDFNVVKKIAKPVILPMTTKFPIIVFSLLCCLSLENILSEKILALKNRDKGRDFYDVWFLLQKEVFIDKKFITKKLLSKIESYPQHKLERDLAPFLPKAQRNIIPMLKRKLLEALE